MLAFVDGTLTVDPALLTVTVDDAARTYGAANPAFSASVDGFVLGDDASILDGRLALRTTATRGSDAGRYAITGSGLEVPDGNYRLAYREGTLTVDPAPLTVTANDAARSYGGADPAFGARFDGFVLGEGAGVLGGTLDFSTDATRRSPVGRYAVSPSGLTSGNYAISYADGALSVTPAPLTVTANDASRTYGAANPDFTARYDGLVLGEGPGELGTLDFATDANRRSDAGSYRVTPGGLTNGNYAVTYAPGTLTVDPAPLDRDHQRRLAHLRRRQPGLLGELRRLRARRGHRGARRRARLRHRCGPRQRGRPLHGDARRADERQLRHQLRPRHADGGPGAADRHDHQRIENLRLGEPGLRRDRGRLRARRGPRRARRRSHLHHRRQPPQRRRRATP